MILKIPTEGRSRYSSWERMTTTPLYITSNCCVHDGYHHVFGPGCIEEFCPKYNNTRYNENMVYQMNVLFILCWKTGSNLWWWWEPHVSEKWLGSKIDAGKTMTTSQIMPTIRTTIVQVCANVLVVGSMQVGGVNYLWILLLILCKKQIVNTIYTQL